MRMDTSVSPLVLFLVVAVHCNQDVIKVDKEPVSVELRPDGCLVSLEHLDCVRDGLACSPLLKKVDDPKTTNSKVENVVHS